MKRLYAFALLCCFAASLMAQQVQDFEDLEAVTKKGFFPTYFKGLFKDFTDFGKPFDYSGGFGVNMRSYNALGTTPRQDPFLYTANANFNARIYKLNLPFSLTIAAKNTEHSYPNPKELYNAFKRDVGNSIAAQKQRFVRFGVSPRYKWIKTHFGHRSMNFSQYTMSNLIFLGAGTELTPGKLRIGAMVGQLAKAEPIDLSLVEPRLPKFQRKGWGVKVGYGTQEDFVDLVLFQAKDQANSIFIPDTLPQLISPEHNEALGLVFQKSLFKKFRLKADIGASALSPNMRDDEAPNQFPHPNFLFQGRQTTKYKTAAEANFDYQASAYSLGLKYRRVDPGYKTLGAYFFNSDIEEWTLNLSTSLFQQAIALNASGGIQRNNLDGSKPNRLSRFVGNLDAAYSKGPLSLTANYSNNSADVAYLLDPADPVLNVLIVTQDAGISATYTIQDTTSQRQHVFNLTGNAQLVTDDVEDPTTSAFSQMLVGNFVYSLALGTSGWGFSAKANFNQNELSSLLVRRYGTGFGATKNWLEGKLSTGLDFNYFYTVTEGLGNNGNFTSALNLNWNLSDAHSLSMNWMLLSTRNTSATASNQFGEVVGTVGYQYRFMRKDKKAAAENKTGKSK
ncbi:MAG: hypothetical protein IT258_10225 [Saprospiraceae bacterium]|nr:hypothetical protein [Saprospiraceae bacterium]